MRTLPRLSFLLATLALVAPGAQAQMLNYGEQLSNYRDARETGVRLNDATFPAVSAKSRVARALAKQTLVDQAALVQPDGTLKLPENQTNLVIRTDYSTVQNTGGQVRVASPTIQGNVSGNVTLYVEGKGIENITILNNAR